MSRYSKVYDKWFEIEILEDDVGNVVMDKDIYKFGKVLMILDEN